MASEGPVNFTEFADDDSVGVNAWNTPENAATSGGGSASCQPSSGAGQIETVKLVVGGSVVGDDFCTRQNLNSTATYYTFGGAGNTGSQSLVGADIKAVDFGIVVQFGDNDGEASTLTHYLKCTAPEFSAIGDEDEVTGITIELRCNWAGFGSINNCDHARITVHYTPSATPEVRKQRAFACNPGTKLDPPPTVFNAGGGSLV